MTDELDNLGTYDGDTVHDMWVDYTTHEYTGEFPYIFDEPDPDDYDDWD